MATSFSGDISENSVAPVTGFTEQPVSTKHNVIMATGSLNIRFMENPYQAGNIETSIMNII
jgi:hypothetical protein